MAEQETPTPASPIDEKIIASVAIGNVKTIGEALAFLTAEKMANHIAHTNRMAIIAEAAAGKVIESIINTDATEGTVDIAAAQQILKGAQTTPPVTT